MTILDKVHICISMIYELEAEAFLSQCKDPLTPQSHSICRCSAPIVM